MTEQLQGLKVVDVLGVFYRDSLRLMVADEFEGTRDVDVILAAFEGQVVRLLVHHRPASPPDRTRWGGGCCLLENTGWCPFGHHEDTQRVFFFNCAGELQRRPGGWQIQAGGEILEVPLECLVAHRGQIIVVRTPDMDSIQRKVDGLDPSNLENASIDELYTRLNDIRNALTDINRLKDGIDV